MHTSNIRSIGAASCPGCPSSSCCHHAAWQSPPSGRRQPHPRRCKSVLWRNLGRLAILELRALLPHTKRPLGLHGRRSSFSAKTEALETPFLGSKAEFRFRVFNFARGFTANRAVCALWLHCPDEGWGPDGIPWARHYLIASQNMRCC